MKTMYEVFVKSAGGVKHAIDQFKTQKEAIEFCDMHGWVWVDENRFEWELDWRAMV